MSWIRSGILFEGSGQYLAPYIHCSKYFESKYESLCTKNCLGIYVYVFQISALAGKRSFQFKTILWPHIIDKYSNSFVFVTRPPLQNNYRYICYVDGNGIKNGLWFVRVTVTVTVTVV